MMFFDVNTIKYMMYKMDELREKTDAEQRKEQMKSWPYEVIMPFKPADLAQLRPSPKAKAAVRGAATADDLEHLHLVSRALYNRE